MIRLKIQTMSYAPVEKVAKAFLGFSHVREMFPEITAIETVSGDVESPRTGDCHIHNL